MTYQIVWGSLILGICSVIHLSLLIVWISASHRWYPAKGNPTRNYRVFILIATTFATIVFAHTVQVWLWAFVFLALGALPNMDDAIYFALVTYTTVGYGDVTVSSDFRLLGGMAAVTGLLNFGVSTAFLVGLLGRVFPRHLH